MSISGIGSVTGTSGTQYDFTSMTNAQAVTAAQTLGKEGKISPEAEIKLIVTASNGGNDTIPIDPAKQANWIADSLSSKTSSNFIDTIKGFLSYDNYSHNAKAAATDSALLKDMQENQSTAGSSSIANQSTIGGIISTTA